MTADSLQLRHVSKAYRRGERRLRVLEDVSLAVRSHEVVAILGSRYEGKTTLLQIAAGLTLPDGGEVWFEGVELTACRAQDRERLLGREIAWSDRSPRQPQLKIVDSVGLPLAMGRGHGLRDVRDLALAALERVGVAECASQYWCDLSNWERVLVALARAIVSSPKLMVIDDLFEGLGMRRTQDACELVATLARELGCGVLMSASDVEATLIADRVFSFERGRLRPIDGDEPDGGARVFKFPAEPRRRDSYGAGA